MTARDFTSGKALALSSIQILLFLLTSSVFSYEKRVYHGIIREDAPPGTEVKLDLQLKPDKQSTGDVCSYAVFSSLQNFPFKVVQDNKGDAVKIILGERFQLDYEKTKEYDFEIEAHDCSESVDYERESVHVDVMDVDDSALDRKQRSYYAEVVEGKRYEKIVRLDVTGDDEADDIFADVCRYRILTPDAPFEVDADGFIRNTEPLDYNRKHSYSLELAVSDCSQYESDRIIVNIEVKAQCKAGWMGVPDRVEFSPREGWKEVAVNAELDLCAGSCNLTRVAVTAILTTGHIGKGCDRDTYSLQSQRKLCGASAGMTDLLPNPSGSSGWTKNLPTDDGQESDRIFAFDGKSTSVEIPGDRVDPHLGNRFTVSTWMKHEDEVMETEQEHDGRTGNGHSGNKGHILCHSDGEGMNRQHYSLHIHSCRLVLLLRRSPGTTGVDTDSLGPGEWRWRLPEVCDKKWHHYVVSVDLPSVELYVDGRKFVENKHNPEILTHGPLHASKHVHSTKLVVGACWMGGKGHMGHYFHGYLAGLSVLRNQTETDDVIRCLNSCQEKLEVPGIDDMENGMTVSMNTEMTSITISGVTVDSVQKLLRRVTYVNSRTFPTPGHRPFALETRATCSDGKPLPVEDVKTLIMVLEPEKPTITLNAARVVEKEEHSLVRGGKIFHNLTISAFTRTEAGEQTDEKDLGSTNVIDSGDRYLLDSCLIRVNPPLNLDFEHIRYPENLLRQLRMEADVSEEGLVIAGADKLVNYAEVMQDLRYVNTRPEELNSRTFVLTCTELNGRFVSNELQVTIEVSHVHHAKTNAPDSANLNKIHEMQEEIPRPARSANINRKNSDTQTVTGIVIMCVVCAGFVVLLVILGVARIRNAQRHAHDVSAEEKQEMEWDNSALTITVNPMDQEVLYDDAYDQGMRCGDSESEDEGSAHENEEDASEGEAEGPEKAKSKELEWDDSTLSF